MAIRQANRQAASYIARKNRRSRQFISELAPWTADTSVTVGYLVQSNGAAWEANESGTTGTTAPAIGSDDIANDGGVTWTRQWRLLVEG